MEQYILNKAHDWLSSEIDEISKNAINDLIDNDEEGLIEAFYKDLEFGTGGLRGLMGVGTNRINEYTIGMATQGLCNYLKKQFPNKILRIAIAHDSRNNSKLFARITAEVASANGIQAFLFPELRPTPSLSFAVRELKCDAGVVVTASHNPKEYNGYKVYWNDGGQLVPPHDKGVIEEVRKISSLDEVNRKPDNGLIQWIDKTVDEAYLDTVKSLGFQKSKSDLRLIFTNLHGTGGVFIPNLLRSRGFENVFEVNSQKQPDGNFPTVVSPNPEESSAMTLALELAEMENADLILGTDPDADRVGIGVRNHKNEMVLLNGNQTAAVMIYYLLQKWKEQGKITSNQYIAKTIVTTDLLTEIAHSFSVKTYETLTGFKYIADLIRHKEGKEVFIGGGEESYGYLIGEAVRDKDAVMSSLIICEAAAWAKNLGKSFWEILLEIYQQYGFYRESLLSITKKGKSGADEIESMMKSLRNDPPKEIAGIAILSVLDYLEGKATHMKTATSTMLNFPKSNVLQFVLEDGSKITARPSGTEPKIKFYFAAKGKLDKVSNFEEAEQQLLHKIEAFKQDLKLN